MMAWYFGDESRTLRHGDGREIALGVTHTHDGTPMLCKSGLHASVRAIDALQYAPGPVLWRVECGGIVVSGHDKIACTRRTYVAGGVDASSMLRAFARWCALSVAHLWDCPDVVARYLVTGDESLRSAAWDAASAAARGAAWGAASAAARGAAWGAARDAAQGAQASQFEAMCESLVEGDCWWEVAQ